MHQMQFVVLNHLMNFRLCREPVCMPNKKATKQRKKEIKKQTNQQTRLDWRQNKKKISNGDPKWFKKNTKKTVKNAI